MFLFKANFKQQRKRVLAFIIVACSLVACLCFYIFLNRNPLQSLHMVVLGDKPMFQAKQNGWFASEHVHLGEMQSAIDPLPAIIDGRAGVDALMLIGILRAVQVTDDPIYNLIHTSFLPAGNYA